jgi:hypothetical protein
MSDKLKQIARAHLDRIGGDHRPMKEDEVMEIFAQVARTGKTPDRLRAAELIGKLLGMFRDSSESSGTSLADLILRAGRPRVVRDGLTTTSGATAVVAVVPGVDHAEESL